MREIKTIIFDFDGTIADSFPLMLKVVNRLAAAHGYATVTETDMSTFRDKSIPQILRHFGISPLRLPWLLAEGRRYFTEEMMHVTPIQGMPEVLETLAQQYRLGIVTSNSQENVSLFLAQYHIENIDFVVSEKKLFGKGRALAETMQEYAVDPATAIYVGDEVRDIEAAKEAHIPCISVAWGFNTKEVLMEHQPSAVIASPEELPNVLEKI